MSCSSARALVILVAIVIGVPFLHIVSQHVQAADAEESAKQASLRATFVQSLDAARDLTANPCEKQFLEIVSPPAELKNERPRLIVAGEILDVQDLPKIEMKRTSGGGVEFYYQRLYFVPLLGRKFPPDSPACQNGR